MLALAASLANYENQVIPHGHLSTPIGLTPIASSNASQIQISPPQVIALDCSTHFLVEKRLGAGTYGQVFAVRHAQTGRSYAMKTIPAHNEKYIQWARCEVDILEKIRDSGAYRYGMTLLKKAAVHEGNLCMFMDKMDGDLLDLIRDREDRPFQVHSIQHIGYQILKAVTKLHSLGIIHADIKPENLLVDRRREGIIKIQLSDFGASVMSARVRNRRGDIMQSLFYRAPEVLYGMFYSEKIDIWSIGCVLAELYLSHSLYPAMDDIQLAYFISSAQSVPSKLMTSLNWQKYFDVRSRSYDGPPIFVPKYSIDRPGAPDKRQRVFHHLDDILSFGYNARFRGSITSLDVQFVRDLQMLLCVDDEFRCNANEAKNLSFFHMDPLSARPMRLPMF